MLNVELEHLPGHQGLRRLCGPEHHQNPEITFHFEAIGP